MWALSLLNSLLQKSFLGVGALAPTSKSSINRALAPEETLRIQPDVSFFHHWFSRELLYDFAVAASAAAKRSLNPSSAFLIVPLMPSSSAFFVAISFSTPA